MTEKTKQQFKNFTDAIWGNFKTKESRAALILAEQAQWKIEDKEFEDWLRLNHVPERVIQYRFEQCDNDIGRLKEELKKDKYLFEFFNLIEPARKEYIKIRNATNEGNTKVDSGEPNN